MTDVDLGRVSSRLLTEVRTVLSRAQTALGWYDEASECWRYDGGWMLQAELETTPGRWGYTEDGTWGWIGPETIPHPDREQIRDALVKVAELLSPWERTGRPLKKP
jgi:hypothetical protein